MISDSALREIASRALKLGPNERLQLIEMLASSLVQNRKSKSTTEHWGEHLVALLDEVDLSAWDDVEDADEWVRSNREQQILDRNFDFGADDD